MYILESIFSNKTAGETEVAGLWGDSGCNCGRIWVPIHAGALVRSGERKAQSCEEQMLRTGTRVRRGVDGTASGQKDLQAVGESGVHHGEVTWL